MRKINGKLFLALLIGLFVLSGTVFAVHHFQYRRIAEALLWQARRAEEQGQVKRMAQYLARYLDFNPHDLEEKANLAKVWAGEEFAGNVKVRAAALRLLEDVLRVEDRPELRRLAVKVALEIRQLKQARDHLALLLPWPQMQASIRADQAARAKNLPAVAPKSDRERKALEERGVLEGQWGQLLEGEKKQADAIGCYRLAVRHAPEEQTNYVGLAYLLRRTNESDPSKRQSNIDEADRTMDDLVARNKPSYLSSLARWRYRRDFDLLAIRETAHKGQVPLEIAAEDVALSLQRKADSVDVLLAAADLERLRSRSALEREGVPLPEREKRMQEHRDRAAQHLKRGLELVAQQQGAAADYSRFQLLWHKASLVLDDMERLSSRPEGERASAKTALVAEVSETIEHIKKTQLPAAADYLRGRLLLHERRWAEAAALLERARAMMAPQPDLAAQANLYLGQCYEKLEEPKLMFDAYRRVLDRDPNSVPALLGMAAARWSQGRLDEAAESYELLLKGQRVPPRGLLDIARLEIQRQIQKDKPEWARAEARLSVAEKLNPTATVEVALLRAEVLIRQKKEEKAEELLLAAREKQPREVDLATALIDLHLSKKEYAKARTIIDEEKKKLGDVVGVRLAEARYQVAEKGAEARAALTALSKGADRFNEEDQARLLGGLASAQFRLGHGDEARALWERLAALPRQRSDLRLRLLLFDLALKDGDEAKMEKALEDIRKVEQSSGAYYRYGQALRLIWRVKNNKIDKAEGVAKARAELDRVLTQRPSWPPVFLARAELAELNGNPQQAIKDLQTARQNGEDGLPVLRRLITLLTENNREAEADLEMHKLKQSILLEPDIGRLRVHLDLKRKEYARALHHTRLMVRADTKDPKELVWQARVYALANEYDKAEKAFGEAVKVAPNDPVPRVALVQFLAERKQRDKALAVLEEGKSKFPDEQKDLALARCYQAMGMAKEADAHFKAALEKQREDVGVVRTVAAFYLESGQLKAAEPLLRELYAQKLRGATSLDKEWAGRGLAEVLASGTDFERFKEALKLVGLELDGNGRLSREDGRDENTENHRTKARVLASQSQKQFRQRAIGLLEGLRTRQALRPRDQFLLAVLYDQEGNTTKARQYLSDLVTSPAKTPQYLAQYALMLIAQRKRPTDLDEADKVIGQLEKAERDRGGKPNDFASVELRVRLLEARGKGKEALALVKKHTAREGARSEEVLLVLASLHRQKQYAEAFELCEKVWSEGKVPPETAGALSVALLRTMGPTDAQVDRIERKLQSAIDKAPDRVVLRMHLADLYDKRGKYEDAEAVYREILKKEPNNVVALNNLAWLMVQRSGAGAGEEALGYINRAVNGLGRRPDLLDTRALAHLALNQHEQAINDLKEATEEAPSPTRLFHLAQAYDKGRDRNRAQEVLREARRRGLKVAELHPVEQQKARELLVEYGIR
jgi:tetratricopeptide (TPR) repeat protein